VTPAAHACELRRGDEIAATGHPTNDEPLQVGQPVTIGHRQGVIQTIVLDGAARRPTMKRTLLAGVAAGAAAGLAISRLKGENSTEGGGR
jgi:hypothetical protein